MLGAQGLWAGRDIYRSTPAVTRDLDFSNLIRRIDLSICLLRHTSGCGGPILTRILTGPIQLLLTTRKGMPIPHFNLEVHAWEVTTVMVIDQHPNQSASDRKSKDNSGCTGWGHSDVKAWMKSMTSWEWMFFFYIFSLLLPCLRHVRTRVRKGPQHLFEWRKGE
jgi:hypothetical protein